MAKSSQYHSDRTLLRQHLITPVVFQPGTEVEGERNRVLVAGKVIEHYAWNFRVGVDMPEGATGYADLYPNARDMLSSQLNNVALLTGIKDRPPIPKKRTPAPRGRARQPDNGRNIDNLYFNSEHWYEEIPSETGRLLGFRHHVFLTPRANPTVLRQAEDGADAPDASDDGANAAGADGGGGGAGGLPEMPGTTPEEETYRAALASPLHFADYLTRIEAQKAEQLYQKHRGDTCNKNKKFHPISYFKQYGFTKYTSSDIFFHQCIQQYYNNPNNTPLPDDYTSAFARLSVNAAWRPLEAFQRGNICNLDSIFTKERMVVDRANIDGQEHPDLRHWRLDSYLASATGHIHAALDAPAPREEDRELLDPMDVDALAEAGGIAAPAPAAAAPAAVARPRASVVSTFISTPAVYLNAGHPEHPPLHTTHLQDIRWPRPDRAFRINPRACLSEILIPHIAFPLPMGAQQPAPDAPIPEIPDLGRMLHAVQRLAEAEHTLINTGGNAPRSHYQNIPVDLAPPSTLDNVGDDNDRSISHLRTEHVNVQARNMAEVVNELRQQDEGVDALLRGIDNIRLGEGDAEGDAARNAERAAHNRAKLAAVMEHQKRVVDGMLRRLAQHYKTHPYHEMIRQNQPEYLFMTECNHDTMSLAEFSRGRNNKQDDFGGYSAARTLLAAYKDQFGEEHVKDMDEKTRETILSGVDSLPEWMLQRNDSLVMRQKSQINKGTMDLKHEARREKVQQTLAQVLGDLRNAMDPTTQEKRADYIHDANLQWDHCLAANNKETRDFYEAGWEELFHLLITSENFSESVVGAMRDFKERILPHAQDYRNHHVLTSALDVRPYVRFVQFLLDSFVAGEKVSEQNLPYLMRCYTCTFHAHRFLPQRSDPALNYLMASRSGAGKTFILNVCEHLTPKDFYRNQTTSTAAAHNVDGDFDHEIEVYHEFDSELLFTNVGGPKDTGATNKINYFKARTTSFCTITQYFHFDEETGLRTAKRCYSSQHNVTIGATNQYLDGMDGPVARRLLIDYIAVRFGKTDGGRSTDTNAFSLWKLSGTAQRIQRYHHELHMAYFFTEMGIRAAVEPDVTDDGARIMKHNVFLDQETYAKISPPSTTKGNWIIEASRVLSILFANFMALYSSTAQAIYSDPASKIGRWTAAMFDRVVSPMLYIHKEAFIHASTMFDFLTSSREEEQLFSTITGRMLNAGKPQAYEYRHVLVNGQQVYDYNYWRLDGVREDTIWDNIANMNKENKVEMRGQDIKAFIVPYYKVFIESHPIRPPADETLDVMPSSYGPVIGNQGVSGGGGGGATAGNKPSRLELRTDLQAVSRPAIMMESDPWNNGKTRQLCFSIDFLITRFNLKLTDSNETIQKRLNTIPDEVDWRLFGNDKIGSTRADRERGLQYLDAYCQCKDSRAMIVGSLRRVLSNKTLERSPWEHERWFPLPKSTYDYSVFYSPDPITVRLETRPSKSIIVPLHGVQSLLRLERKPDGPLMTYTNYDKPLPSAYDLLFTDPVRAHEKNEKNRRHRNRVVEQAMVAADAMDIDLAATVTSAMDVDELDPDMEYGNDAMDVCDQPQIGRGVLVDGNCIDYIMAKKRMELKAQPGIRLLEKAIVDSLKCTRPEEIAELPEELRMLMEDVKENRPARRPLPYNFMPILQRLESGFHGRMMTAERKLMLERTKFPASNAMSRISDSVYRHKSVLDGTYSAYDSYEETVGLGGPTLLGRKRPRASGQRTEVVLGLAADGDYMGDDERPHRRAYQSVS